MASRPAIYAHRFGGQLGPESSRAALQRSLSGPVDGFEADVVLSADGEVLACHDPLLQLSTADLSGWAHQYPAAVLTRAHLLDGQGGPSDQSPLLLRQVLEIIPSDLPLQLDIKAYADIELAQRTAEACCQTSAEVGRASQIEVISFFTPACEAAVAHGARARLVLWADYDPQALVKWVLDRGIGGLSLEGFILNQEFRDTAREAGLSISIGAVNTAEQLDRLLPLEPEIIVSDTPHMIRAMVDAYYDAGPSPVSHAGAPR
jgi:glycerophosphoryl diester phosphodiesterase